MNKESVREILENIYDREILNTDDNKKCIDQALSDISEILKGCVNKKGLKSDILTAISVHFKTPSAENKEWNDTLGRILHNISDVDLEYWFKELKANIQSKLK